MKRLEWGPVSQKQQEPNVMFNRVINIVLSNLPDQKIIQARAKTGDYSQNIRDEFRFKIIHDSHPTNQGEINILHLIMEEIHADHPWSMALIVDSDVEHIIGITVVNDSYIQLYLSRPINFAEAVRKIQPTN